MDGDMIEEFALGTSRVYRIPLVESGRDGERAAVSRLVARAFGNDARLLHAPNGRPYVEGGAGGGGRFISVSHGAGMALLAVNARRRIGIDVEAPRMQLHRVAAKFLHADEAAVWGGSMERLLAAWTVKEAVYKALWMDGAALAEIRLPDDGGDGFAWYEGRGASRRFDLYAAEGEGWRLTLAEERFPEKHLAF